MLRDRFYRPRAPLTFMFSTLLRVCVLSSSNGSDETIRFSGARKRDCGAVLCLEGGAPREGCDHHEKGPGGIEYQLRPGRDRGGDEQRGFVRVACEGHA